MGEPRDLYVEPRQMVGYIVCCGLPSTGIDRDDDLADPALCHPVDQPLDVEIIGPIPSSGDKVPPST